ncbi:MAG TPA: ATP-binding protein [Bryobacteraceae bacterium]|jgi:serine/threonine-protein kinase RsbW|nr:ATP-binding protein [Bryobacteraceae bacterium]
MEAHTLEQELESTLESVDNAEQIVLAEAQTLGLDDDDLYRVGIAIRECMVNAVVHGNRYNSRKKVHLKVERTADRLTIVVGDEGEGFDPSAVPDPLAGENLLRGSGRGVMLMQSFMDEFQISQRQPQGTEVKMVKYKAKAT